MEIIILYVCLQLILFLLIFMFVEIRGIRKLIDNYIIKQQNDVAISQDDKDAFLEEDKKKAIEEKERVKINTDIAAKNLKCLKDIVEWVNDCVNE